jgi:fatty acid amide hydrolase 2
MDDHDLLTMAAVDLAAAVRSGSVTPAAVVDAHIRRVLAVNPSINAVVADRFDLARREAEAAGRELAVRASAARVSAGSRPTTDRHVGPVSAMPPQPDRPLLGVPFSTKEMIEVEGMPLTFGSAARRQRRGRRDASVVARLRAAGAILLGVTNVPEWGMWSETYNRVYGRTNNPWDVRHTAGGSSGGEGAIVGAGGTAFGIGADIGGSVRIPAACCGVYGHKPTTGLLPLTGHYPVYVDGPDAGLPKRAPYVTIGTFTRSARDIALLLRVMAGPDAVDPNAERIAIGDPDSVDWDGRRVLVLEAPVIARAARTRPEARHAVRSVAAALAGAGAATQAVPADLFRRAGDIWFAALQSVGSAPFSDMIGGGRRVRLGREVLAAAVGGGAYSWPALFFCIGERIGRRGRAGLQHALAELHAVEAQVADLLGDEGVLIMPTQPRSAPRHYAPVLRPFDFLYTAVMNALRLPATTMPLGLDRRGLPLAVQVVSARGNDHLTIAAAGLAGHWHGLPGRP